MAKLDPKDGLVGIITCSNRDLTQTQLISITARIL